MAWPLRIDLIGSETKFSRRLTSGFQHYVSTDGQGAIRGKLSLPVPEASFPAIKFAPEIGRRIDPLS